MAVSKPNRNTVEKLFSGDSPQVARTREGDKLIGFITHCPKCGTTLQVGTKQVKMRVRCGKCGQAIEIIGTGSHPGTDIQGS